MDGCDEFLDRVGQDVILDGDVLTQMYRDACLTTHGCPTEAAITHWYNDVKGERTLIMSIVFQNGHAACLGRILFRLLVERIALGDKEQDALRWIGDKIEAKYREALRDGHDHE